MRKTICALSLLAMPLFGEEVSLKAIDKTGRAVEAARLELSRRGSTEVWRCEGECQLNLSPGEYEVRGTAPDLEGVARLVVDKPAITFTLLLEPLALRSRITVVSSSRFEELQEESTTKVEAITREQMLTTGYERVSDVLQEIPGVLVRRGNTATVGGEQVQGLDSRQVLVLQDGLPVVGARGIKAGAINLNRQSSDRMERVEVAKGSGSSHYGSDAVGGVINMITREPANPFEGGYTLSGGSLGTLDLRGDVGGKFQNGFYFLNLGESRMNAYRLIPNSVTTVGPDVRRQDILFKTRAQLKPSFGLGFTVNAYRNRDEGQNLSETGPVQGLSNDSTQTYALIADFTINPLTTLQARAYSARYDENNLTSPIGRLVEPSRANLNERLSRVDATISRQAGNQHLVQGGFEWSHILYRGANRLAGDNVGQSVTMSDAWLQDRWTLHRKWTLTAGGRITSHSLFGQAAVPKAGLIYKINDSWIARASFGMGFRAPDLGQLYFRFANPATFYQVIGNPNLRPEHSQSYQAGLLYRQRSYRLGFSLYQNNVRDLIDARLVGTPRSANDLNTILTNFGIPAFFDPLLNRQTFLYVNQSRIFTRGFEVDGEYSVNRNFRASGAYTFLNALDRNSRLGLPQRHRHQGQVRFDWSSRRTGLNANIRGTFLSHWLLNAATGTRGLPYQIWDSYVGKNWKRGFQTYLAIDNFNNSRDGKLRLPVPSFDRPDFGRTFRVGLRHRFGQTD